jgi:hypothetical protein
MASIASADPDPRTDAEDAEDATNLGVSSTEPAEGEDDEPSRDSGSPQG